MKTYSIISLNTASAVNIGFKSNIGALVIALVSQYRFRSKHRIPLLLTKNIYYYVSIPLPQ